MFERFRRNRGTDGDGYGDGAAFQRGDGYNGQQAGDGVAGERQGYGDRTATYAGDRGNYAQDSTDAREGAYAGEPGGYDDRNRAGYDNGRTGNGVAGTQVGDGVDERNTGRTGRGRGVATGAVAGGAAGAAVEHERDMRTRGPATGAAGPTTAAEARAVQRERFGGADGTAIFFGWLSALGLAALLLAVVGAAGTRLGFAANVNQSDATNNAGTLGIVGAAILVVVLLLAYYGGGYVAGRMARFDGGRQGFRVWLLGLLVTIAAAVAGWIGGSQYNVFQQLNLPRIPVNEGTIATGAIITLVVVLLGTLLAAMAGGKAGDRYHARIDGYAWDRNRD